MQRRGSILGLGSGFLWGLDTVILGIALSFSVMLDLGAGASLVATFIHDGISFLFLLLLIIKLKSFNEFIMVLKSKSGKAIILAALLGGPIGMGSYILAIKYLGAALASSISAIYPAVGAVLAFVFLKERLRKHSIVGLCIAMVAIALMGFTATIEVSNLLLGIVFLGLCIVGWGSEAVIINAALKEDVSSEIALGIRQLTSFVVYLFIIMPLVGYNKVAIITQAPSIILIILVSGLMGTLSYLCYYKSIDLIGATQAMGLNISYPAWAFFFQFLINREFSFILFVLVIFIMIGSIMSNDKPLDLLKIFKSKE